MGEIQGSPKGVGQRKSRPRHLGPDGCADARSTVLAVSEKRASSVFMGLKKGKQSGRKLIDALTAAGERGRSFSHAEDQLFPGKMQEIALDA